MSRKVWIMGAGVVVLCCAADMVMHCENWAMIGATLLGGAVLGYKTLQKAEEQPISESDSRENDKYAESNSNEEMLIEHCFELTLSTHDSDDEHKAEVVVKALMPGSPSLSYSFSNLGKSPLRVGAQSDPGSAHRCR